MGCKHQKLPVNDLNVIMRGLNRQKRRQTIMAVGNDTNAFIDVRNFHKQDCQPAVSPRKFTKALLKSHMRKAAAPTASVMK